MIKNHSSPLNPWLISSVVVNTAQTESKTLQRLERTKTKTHFHFEHFQYWIWDFLHRNCTSLLPVVPVEYHTTRKVLFYFKDHEIYFQMEVCHIDQVTWKTFFCSVLNPTAGDPLSFKRGPQGCKASSSKEKEVQQMELNKLRGMLQKVLWSWLWGNLIPQATWDPRHKDGSLAKKCTRATVCLLSQTLPHL